MNNIKKWEKEYIEGLDISKIKWIKLNSLELEQFLKENYFDERLYNYVGTFDNVFLNPLGLHYLTLDSTMGATYILGVVENNIGKSTIVAVAKLDEKYYIFTNQDNPITYVAFAETNSYFRNLGIFKKLCDVFYDFINPEQHILASKESEFGEKVHTFNHLKTALLARGFKKEIIHDDHRMQTYEIFASLKRQRIK